MASTATAHPSGRPPPRSRPWDLVGLGLVVALCAWTLVAAAGRSDARPLPVLALLGAATALFAAGRAGSRWPGPLVPGIVAVGIAGSFALTFPGVLGAGGAPTGYGNTNGALAAVGTVAAVAAMSATGSTARLGWLAIAVLLTGCVALTGSVGAGLALTVAALLALASLLRRDASVSALGGLVATWLALGVTSAIAAGSRVGAVAEEDELRVELWAQALDLAHEAPLRGVGPGSFAARSVVSADVDLRWAHHEYLEHAAETGVAGLLLLLALVGWLFTYLWWGRGRGLARTIAGAAALTVVSLHATVDHVLHTPVIPLTVAALAGWATADPRFDGAIAMPGPTRRSRAEGAR